MKTNGKHPVTKTFRCAIYTRKSTEEGLEQEFNSLDAQRDGAESYIKSQANEGWICLPDRYDDGGFTGGNMDRPALQRLFADIEAGKIDAVVVYKVDRLSRSLLDFTRMMEKFEKHNVAFVSTTQQIHTGTSMGRLILNMLLSFAQFEREMISERTRDKIAAARRKGHWSGGMPLLGYDLSADSKLLVNEKEAEHVRSIFDLYLQHEALAPVVAEINRRGWTNKRWRTRKGPERGGKPFSKSTLHRFLCNPVFIGRVRYKSETHPGQHQGIVDPAVWQKVQDRMRSNGQTGGAKVRNRFGALLKGLLRCTPCGCAMTPSHSTSGQTRYRYYTCVSAQKRGHKTCPSKSLAAAEIERVVLDKIRHIGQDRALQQEVFRQTRQESESRLAELRSEELNMHRDLEYAREEVDRLLAQGGAPDRLADFQTRLLDTEKRLSETRREILVLSARMTDESTLCRALASFDPVWASLTPREQTRLVELLVEKVEYDGTTKKLSIAFHSTGIRSLADELARKEIA